MKRKIVHKTKRVYSAKKKSSLSFIPILFIITALVLTFAVLKSGFKLGLNPSAQDKCDIHLFAQITDNKGQPLETEDKYSEIVYYSNKATYDTIRQRNLKGEKWKSNNYILHNVDKKGIGKLFYPGDYVNWKLKNGNDYLNGEIWNNNPNDRYHYVLAGSNVRVCDFDNNATTTGKNCVDNIKATDSFENTNFSTERVKLECNKKYITGWWYKKKNGPIPPLSTRYVNKIKFQAQITDKSGNAISTNWNLYFSGIAVIEEMENTSKSKFYNSIAGPKIEDKAKPALGKDVNFYELGGIKYWPYFTIELFKESSAELYTHPLLGNNVRVCQYDDTDCLKHKKGEEATYGFKDYTCVVRSGEPADKCLSTETLVLDKESQVIVGWWFAD